MPGIPYNTINPNEHFQASKNTFCDIKKNYRCPLNNSCKVKWNEQLQHFACECHGCKFSLTGKLISGPSQEDLKC
jgi:nitrite reductase/ring-hydroxylating ferredoxin subunit